jgi:peptidoglycan/LPS O-acetylase OafA/YrhL
MTAAKRYFIYPRIGYVKFREVEQVDGNAILRVIISLIVFAVASPFMSILLLGKEPGWEFWTRRFLPFFLGGITAIGPVIAAAKLHVKRWYAFAVVCIAAGLGVPYLGMESIYTPIGTEFIIIGGFVFCTGLVMFLAFLIKYSVETIEEEPVNG